MKKDTPETKIPFTITKTSLEKVNYIINNMENKSFHNHYHILYDIEEDTIFMVVFRHDRRHPSFGTKRIKNPVA